MRVVIVRVLSRLRRSTLVCRALSVRDTESEENILTYEKGSSRRSKNAHQSGRAVYGTNGLRPFEHWDCEFESYSMHGCLCAFIICLSCSVCR
jgi:hypothetical protein